MSKRKTKDKFAFNKNDILKSTFGKIETRVAQTILDQWHNTYPQYKGYKNRLKELTKDIIKWHNSPDYKREKLYEAIQVIGTK